MNDDDKYLFDLNGYILIEEVLDQDEIAAANEAIDRHLDRGKYRDRELTLAGGSPTLEGQIGRGDLGGMLGWDEPWCLPFRRMLTHPKLIPYLNEIMGRGFRMDHSMFLLWMDKGAEGCTLHGSSGPHFDPNQYYIFRDGRMHNGLSVASIQLTDVNPGDGGFALIPGSHKGNFACPGEMRRNLKYQEHIRQITCRAGDAVIFTEAVTHGTLPWTSDEPRRSIMTRYTAGNLAYVPAPPVPEWANDREQAVLQPPYHSRLDRPFLEE